MISRVITLLTLVLVAGLLGAAPAPQSAAPRSTATPGLTPVRPAGPAQPNVGIAEIPTIGGNYSVAIAISDSGQVAGFANASTATVSDHAIRWSPDTGILDLGLPAGATYSDARGINAAGDVVGTHSFRDAQGIGRPRAYRWLASGGMQALSGLGGVQWGAYDINDAGTVVGYSNLPAGPNGETTARAVRWVNGGAPTDLGTLGGAVQAANAINSSGEIVGYAGVASGVYHAFRWSQSGGMQDLGTLSGGDTFAYDINNTGLVVGTSGSRAFVWSALTGMVDLGSAQARAVNDAGVVVGYGGGFNTRAYMWKDLVLTDLNTVLPPGSGWVLEEAHDINNAGQITGKGRLNGQTRGFVLSLVDLNATALEVTQAIQDLQNTVPLIAGKRTFARLHVRSTEDRTKNVTAQLIGMRGGATLGTLKPQNNPTAMIDVKKQPDRGTLDDSFWFELPASWVSEGDLTLQAEVNPERNPPTDPSRPITEIDYSNNVRNENVSFQRVNDLYVRVMKYQYTTSGGGFASVPDSHVELLSSYLRRLYPVSQVHVRVSTFLNDEPIFLRSVLLLEMSALRAAGAIPFTDASAREYWYIMLPNAALGGTFVQGLANPLSKIALGPTGPTPFCNDYGCWDSDGSYGDWYGAHEIGHLLGGNHTGICGDLRLPGTAVYPYPGGIIGGPEGDTTRFYGFDAGDARLSLPMAVIPPTATDAMTYCPEEWISDFTYRRILNTVRTSGAARPAAGLGRAIAGDWLVVDGIIDPVTQVVDPFLLSRRPEVGAIPPLIPGPYRLTLLDAGGGVLNTQRFTPLPDAEGALYFSQIVPFAPGVRRVTINVDATGTEIGGRDVSVSPPTVAVTGRTGGSPAAGAITFSWSATDPDGDPLRFTVQYRPNSNTPWQPLGTTRATSFTVDAATLVGNGGAATGVLQVVASDGVLTSTATSAPFAVSEKGPTATIVSPANGSVFTPGQTVPLVGSGQDLEDGTLADGRLRWTSSRDGDLGTGGINFRTNLSVGVHVITLTATDSSNLQGQATITVTIAGGTIGPILSTRPDTLAIPYAIGGPPPATQVVSISNPGSGVLAWTATASAPWITLSAPSGNGPGNLTVGINTAALPAGSYYHSGQVTISATGAIGSPKVINLVAQASNPPTATATRTSTSTPLVSATPTPSATRTPTRSPTATSPSPPTFTRTPTLVPSPSPTRSPTPSVGSTVGGSGFTLEAGSPVRLRWNGGTGQGTYLVARWSPESGLVFLPPTTGSLPPTATSLLDDAPLTDNAYCYILFALGPGFPSTIDLRRISDMLCLYPDTSYPVAPGQFSVRLDESPLARLRWTAPGGQVGYDLTAFTFDGASDVLTSLPSTAVEYTFDTHGGSTCFYLDAYADKGYVGGTDVICAVPNIAVLVTGDAPRSLADAVDRLAAIVQSGPRPRTRP